MIKKDVMTQLEPATTAVASELPRKVLLRRYGVLGGHVDCFAIEVNRRVSLAAYVEAFYTTWLFKLERAILAVAGHGSSDGEARALAEGARDTFAAWHVEDRTEQELLMCDVTGRTRSWFKATPSRNGLPNRTLLLFGSAITPVINVKTGKTTIGPVFRALMGSHVLYSRALLAATARRIGTTAHNKKDLRTSP